MSASSAGAYNRQQAATQSSRSRQSTPAPTTPVTGQGQRVEGGNNGTTPFNSQFTSTMYDVSNQSSVERPASSMVVREATVDQGGRDNDAI